MFVTYLVVLAALVTLLHNNYVEFDGAFFQSLGIESSGSGLRWQGGRVAHYKQHTFCAQSMHYKL